jgi:hypothetical protein
MDKKSYPCERVVAIDQEPRHHLVIANEFVRGFAVEIAPHDRTLCHHHAHDYLMYVAGDAQIISTPRDGDPQMHNHRDGDCELSRPGMVHVVENLTDTPFRNLLVESLAEASGLRPGPNPRIVSGEATITRHFAVERISVFLLEMEDGSEAELHGPAIVASPYKQEVELATWQGAAKLAHFKELAWLEPFTAATLCNHANTAARVVCIVLGTPP